jgi:hypothetical protein
VVRVDGKGALVRHGGVLLLAVAAVDDPQIGPDVGQSRAGLQRLAKPRMGPGEVLFHQGLGAEVVVELGRGLHIAQPPNFFPRGLPASADIYHVLLQAVPHFRVGVHADQGGVVEVAPLGQRFHFPVPGFQARLSGQRYEQVGKGQAVAGFSLESFPRRQSDHGIVGEIEQIGAGRGVSERPGRVVTWLQVAFPGCDEFPHGRGGLQWIEIRGRVDRLALERRYVPQGRRSRGTAAEHQPGQAQ